MVWASSGPGGVVLFACLVFLLHLGAGAQDEAEQEKYDV